MDLNEKRIMLIGGAGHAGSHIVDQLLTTRPVGFAASTPLRDGLERVVRWRNGQLAAR
jgi:nucleoside-diphosphate-sugar epimerase